MPQTAIEDTLAGFERSSYLVKGVPTVVYAAGQGDPLVFLHGSGTFPGFGFAKQWTTNNRVIIPYHPGYGESGDDDEIGSIHDYVLHYLELFDTLGLNDIHLAGASLGGWFAAEIALVQPGRFRSLSLAAPAGLYVAEPAATDLFTIPPEKLVEHLVNDPDALLPYLPEGHDVEFLTLRYRETISTARLLWEDPKGGSMLNRWLERIRLPTLLLWGDADRVRPAAHGQVWLSRLPNARLEIIPSAGHLVLEEAKDAAGRIARFTAAH